MSVQDTKTFFSRGRFWPRSGDNEMPWELWISLTTIQSGLISTPGVRAGAWGISGCSEHNVLLVSACRELAVWKKDNTCTLITMGQSGRWEPLLKGVCVCVSGRGCGE